MTCSYKRLWFVITRAKWIIIKHLNWTPRIQPLTMMNMKIWWRCGFHAILSDWQVPPAASSSKYRRCQTILCHDTKCSHQQGVPYSELMSGVCPYTQQTQHNTTQVRVVKITSPISLWLILILINFQRHTIKVCSRLCDSEILNYFYIFSSFFLLRSLYSVGFLLPHACTWCEWQSQHLDSFNFKTATSQNERALY